jgi:hypothetical protein
MYDEKDLVNHILFTLGEDTTPTLTTQHPAVLSARTFLSSIDKEFQGRGFWFNRERSIKLLPDSFGKVRIPDETLSFVITNCVTVTQPDKERTRYVKRGGYVYDAYNHTNILNTALWADLVIRLPIDDLPPTAASYLKALAADRAFLASDGDVQVYRELQRQTALAWNLLFAEELKASKLNALTTPSAAKLRYSIGSSPNANLLGG